MLIVNVIARGNFVASLIKALKAFAVACSLMLLMFFGCLFVVGERPGKGGVWLFEMVGFVAGMVYYFSPSSKKG